MSTVKTILGKRASRDWKNRLTDFPGLGNSRNRGG
jgi:hypothetical protein